MVPGCTQSAVLDADLGALHGLAQVDDDVPHDGEVLGCVVDPDAAFVFAERDVQDPVQTVLDPPNARERSAGPWPPGASAPGTDPPAALVELSGAQILGAMGGTTGPVVELSNDGGIRMTPRLAAGDTLDVPRAVAAFRGVGS